MNIILAIDPGTDRSAWVVWEHASQRILDMGLDDNYALRDRLRGNDWMHVHECVIERIVAHGKATAATTLVTCEWTGVFREAWNRSTGCAAHWLPRESVKQHLCHSGSAKDPHIRQALIDRLGPPGTKKKPGVTYGVTKDVWAALAVAVTFGDLHYGKEKMHA